MLKKILISMFLILCIGLVGCQSKTVNETTETIETVESSMPTEPTIVLDYENAASFEKALNEGEKVKGKIVQFVVNDYQPDSALGINCWAGEHLNFISEKELDVEAGDVIVGCVIEEPSIVLFDSWKIPFEIIEVVVNNQTGTTESFEDSTKNETSTKETTEPILEESQARVPETEYLLESYEPDEVQEIFKKAGFTNINKQAIYDLDFTSRWDSYSLNDIETITIAGIDDFEAQDVFEKSSEIIITYHAYEKDNPDIVYNQYTVTQLFDDLESNALRAKEEHLNEHVEIKGKILEIDGNGNYILICGTKDNYGYDFIYCGIETEELENQLYELSTGDIITVRGKINVVDTIYDYTVNVYTIK